jgi:hypothetical protein
MVETAIPHSTSSSVTPHIQQSLFIKVAFSTLRSRNGLFIPSQASQAKVLTGDKELRGAQIDVPLSVKGITLR